MQSFEILSDEEFDELEALLGAMAVKTASLQCLCSMAF